MDWPALAAAIGGPAVGLAAVRQARSDSDARRHESDADRRLRRLHELDDAMAAFLAALSKAIAFLTNMPHIDPRHPLVLFGRATDRVSDALVPGRTWLRNRRGLAKALPGDPYAAANEVVEAAARLRVLDPGDALDTAIENALDYLIELGEDRADEKLARWPHVRREVLGAIKATRAALA
jgi:hypothetical protein